MIRRDIEPRLRSLAGRFPSITLVGPRQSGKTTLCQSVFGHLPYRSLESPDVRGRAAEDPRLFLDSLPDGAVLDEVQRVPSIVSYLQEYIDRDRRPGRWILTGSQNFALVESITQSLAGRTAMCHLLPLAWSEIRREAGHPDALVDVLLRGGFPELHARPVGPATSVEVAGYESTWFESYLTAYVERDVRQLVRVNDLDAFQRFIQLVGLRSGQLLNMAAFAGEVGISQPTVKSWLGVLEASFLAVRLPPFHSNLGKRLVRAPKVHLIDSGLLCHLLGIRSAAQLSGHPQRGAVFESWVASEIVKSRVNRGIVGGPAARTAFLRDDHGVEVDVVCESVSEAGKPSLRLVEAKMSETASGGWFTGARSMATAFGAQYEIDSYAIYAGRERQQRSGGTILPWREIDSVEW